MQLLLDYIYQLNWFTVIVAAAVGFLVNAIWYSDALFGKPWRKAVKLKKNDSKKPGVDLALVIAFITILVTSAALGILVDALQVSGALQGVLLGVLVGFGFTVMSSGMHKLFEQRPFEHFVISATGDLLTLAAIGAILAVW